ncbi:MAG TPA: regulatory protein RecX [Alphaproteobacteria bacterium]|nr:regulatory protein RecX [Alphaproteobacteria bacterium]
MTDSDSKSAPPKSKRAPDAKRTARGPKPVKKATAQYLENAALFYLGRFSASSGHLRRLLVQRVDRSAKAHGTDPVAGRDMVDKLIARFLSSGLLDDAAFAAGKARSLRRRGASRSVIAQKLRAKSVTADRIDDAVQTADRDAIEDGEDAELNAAWRLARRKRVGPYRKQADRAELRTKDMAALARGGFSYDVARRVIDADIEDAPRD